MLSLLWACKYFQSEDHPHPSPARATASGWDRQGGERTLGTPWALSSGQTSADLALAPVWPQHPSRPSGTWADGDVRAWRRPALPLRARWGSQKGGAPAGAPTGNGRAAMAVPGSGSAAGPRAPRVRGRFIQ